MAFLLYYSKGMMAPVVVVSILSAAIAIMEVSLFGFLGQLVDWLTNQDKATFIEQNQNTLIGWGLLLLVVLPGIVILQSLLVHQTLLGNYPMKIRWQAHKYLLAQSLSFFQDEFAGRVATKVMQTSLAVREAVMKVLDILVYIGVYFISIVLLVAVIDWRQRTAQSGEVAKRTQDDITGSDASTNKINDTSGDYDQLLAKQVEKLIVNESLYLQANLKVSDVAQHLSLPEYRISKALRYCLNAKNFNQYINELRIQHAQGLLADPNNQKWPVLVVGLESGFASIGPFTRTFKSITGLTPNQFRKQSLSANLNMVDNIPASA
jgi:AraC-like DNA-binding protein